jgi:hypothetical protein
MQPGPPQVSQPHALSQTKSSPVHEAGGVMHAVIGTWGSPHASVVRSMQTSSSAQPHGSASPVLLSPELDVSALELDELSDVLGSAVDDDSLSPTDDEVSDVDDDVDVSPVVSSPLATSSAHPPSTSVQTTILRTRRD